MAWKTISSKSIYKNRWIELLEDKFLVTENYVEGVYTVVKKEDAVGIIPWDGKNTYLVGQYRYPVKSYSWEFPQGHVESKVHKTVLNAAKDELEEEAGLVAKKMTEVGEFYIAPGITTQKYHLYIATDLTKGRQKLEPNEIGMVVKKVSLKEVDKMIKKGEIVDSPTISMIYFLKRYLLNE